MTRFWLGPVLFIFVNEPSLIVKVLNSPDCIEKSFTYKFLRLDKGLLAAKREFLQKKVITYIVLFQFSQRKKMFCLLFNIAINIVHEYIIFKKIFGNKMCIVCFWLICARFEKLSNQPK